MIKQLLSVVTVVIFCACGQQTEKGRFTVTGDIKNMPDQAIYLEELYFTQKDPTVLDTGEIRQGKFAVSALAPTEGLYRLRFEKSEAAFFFINDQPAITFNADHNKLSLDDKMFNTSVNESLRKFMASVNSHRKELEEKSTAIQQYGNKAATDSLYNSMQQEYTQRQKSFEDYILQYLDTTSNSILALFSLGYTRNIEPDRLDKVVGKLTTRFPDNPAIAAVAAQYNQMIAQYKAKPHVGGVAPDISMADTSGKSFSLSMLKGKYVLVDFWASWCGPCRGENPNVVKAYNSYKDKNFTVLGVSLDKDRESWIKAIKDDQLAWYHISDLKHWNSAAVPLYGFDGIPYNVLVNPEGKIIGENLRGEGLEMKLAELIK